ncbi:MAG: hypothetical protein FWD53_12790, partial [Phycisphaerales bacterium]|nr:hypothetical protein [Phycisphaerales bacterium]
ARAAAAAVTVTWHRHLADVPSNFKASGLQSRGFFFKLYFFVALFWVAHWGVGRYNCQISRFGWAHRGLVDS